MEEGMYYTGPEERLKHTADEGEPKVIVRRIAEGKSRDYKNQRAERRFPRHDFLLVHPHSDNDAF